MQQENVSLLTDTEAELFAPTRCFYFQPLSPELVLVAAQYDGYMSAYMDASTVSLPITQEQEAS